MKGILVALWSESLKIYKSRVFWFSMVFFIFIIVFNVWIMVPKLDPDSAVFRAVVWIYLALLTLSFVVIIPYLFFVFRFLQPDSIIHSLEGAARDHLRNALENPLHLGEAKMRFLDTVEQIGDIGVKSIASMDRSLGLSCVGALQRGEAHDRPGMVRAVGGRERLVGGATEETIIARVGEGIVSAIGSAETHAQVLENPDMISKTVLARKLDSQTAFKIVSIDIADIDVGENIGARLQADQAQAAAILEQARQSDERVKKLVARQVATAEESDKATEALSVAQAGVARAEAALLEGRKQLIAAEKNLDFRRAVLADTQVSAPFDGLIVRRYRDPGDIVVPGSPALTLVSLDEIWISAWVDETEMARLRVDQPARVVFRSEPRVGYQGRVARLGREADRETREFVVDVRVLKLPENWAVGQRAEVYIQTDRKMAVPLLPTRYVVWRNEEAGVFCKVGGRAQWRPVTLGLQARETAEIAAGLREGDVVLTAVSSKGPSLEGRRVVAP